MRLVVDSQLRAGDRAHAEAAAGVRELHRAPDAVVVGERNRRIAVDGRGGRQLLGARSTVEERIGRVGVQLGVRTFTLLSG